jgi:hypothetical protein
MIMNAIAEAKGEKMRAIPREIGINFIVDFNKWLSPKTNKSQHC